MRRALLLAVLVLAGCGAGTHSSAPKPPRLPRALAQAWASQADAVAAAIANGDGCTARTRAVQLQRRVITAVNERRVPRRYQESLVSGVNDLAARIVCTPPAVIAIRDRSRGHGPGHDHGRGHPKPHGRGEQGDG